MRWTPGDTRRLSDRTKEYAVEQCMRYREVLAKCTTGKTVTVAWECREERNKMVECMANL